MNDLTEKAMLVKLSVTKWSARKHDKKVSKEVAANYGTAEDRGRYNKILIAQEHLKAISQAENAARTFHYQQTLPWKDDGARILPSANYLGYTAEIRKLKADFEKEVAAFLDLYSALVSQARYELNGLFNQADYPDPGKIGTKFTFEMEVDPLPAAEDFRVTLQGDEVNRIKSEIAARLEAAQQAAVNDLYTRLHGAIRHMQEKLADKEGIFRDSLVINIRELCELIPRLNFTGDSRLEELRAQAEKDLAAYDPEDLRKNQFARQETADAAADLLAKMAGYTGIAA
jgi:hypothetical protein